jgi:hypothetical protein
MTTKREYAISLGLAQAGRGRMSKEANEAIAKAELDGMVFDTPVVVPPRVNTKVVTDWHPTPREPRVAREIPEGPSKAFTGKFEVQIPGGKRKALNERTACTCGASLVYCHCSTPTVYETIVNPGTDNIDSVLNIERV